MRVWIVGQKSFGAAVLERLAPLVDVVGVTCPPGDKLEQAVLERTWTPDHGEQLVRLAQFDIDVIINAHGHAFIDKAVREQAKHGAIGYHPSLLPRHRGRSAVEWTIASGDRIAGGTVYQLDDGYDTGPIIRQDWCHVDLQWSASDLWRERLFGMGVDLLEDVVAWGKHGWPGFQGEPQDERFATYESPWYDTFGKASCPSGRIPGPRPVR